MRRKHNKDLVPAARELRKNMTSEEKRLWYDFLRTYHVRFSRQKIIGYYIVDFYSAEARLVIEVDGLQHASEEGMRYDEERTAFLEKYGLRGVRIPNKAVRENFAGVCGYIDTIVKESLPKADERAP